AHSDWHMRRFGFARPNVRFLKGYIERLEELGLAPARFDVIVSNCVINLSIDKSAVLRGAYDLLKPGGELYFADVYCDRRLPDSVRADPVLYGECLGGALYWDELLPRAKRAGFLDPRLVTSKPLDIKNEAMKRKIGQAKFFSRRIAYSSSMGSSRPAQITGRSSSTKAVCPTSRTHSSSTVTILSRRARSSRCAAIPGACSPIR